MNALCIVCARRISAAYRAELLQAAHLDTAVCPACRTAIGDVREALGRDAAPRRPETAPPAPEDVR